MVAATVVPLTGDYLHQTILLASEGLQRPGRILAVQDEDDAVLLGYLLQRTSSGLLVGDGLGQELLPLGPQLLPRGPRRLVPGGPCPARATPPCGPRSGAGASRSWTLAKG